MTKCQHCDAEVLSNRMGTTPEMQKMYDEFGGESAHDAMLELGQQTDPIREALRRMIAEFGDEHYHTCPADNDSGPCDCFAGHLIVDARTTLAAALAATPAPECCKGLAPIWECQCEKDRVAATPAVGILSREKSDQVLSECGYEPATPAAGGEALAWRYELAHARFWPDDKTPGDYTDWRWTINETKPHAGDAVRNLTPLYAAQAASPLRADATAWRDRACKAESRLEYMERKYGKVAWDSASPPEQPAADPVMERDDFYERALEKRAIELAIAAVSKVVRRREDMGNTHFVELSAAIIDSLSPKATK